MKIKTLKTKTDRYKIKTEISTEKQNDEVKIKTLKNKIGKRQNKNQNQNRKAK